MRVLALFALVFWGGLTSQAQTFQVLDLWPGMPSSEPKQLTPAGNKMIFVASVQGTGNEPWVTDGTLSGSFRLKDIAAGVTSSNPLYITALNDSTILFTADDQVHGNELWVTDGTTAGTHMVMDLALGSASSDPQNLIVFQNAVWFRASTPTTGYELYKSDGTASGTQLVKDIYPGTIGSMPNDFCIFNGQLFFAAADPTHGPELWSTDGTTTGTQLLVDIRPGTTGSYPAKMFAWNGQIYFSADNGTNGSELFISDGTASGTQFVKDINPGNGGSNIMNLQGMGSKVYFSASTWTQGAEIYSSDGTASGTALLKDINVGTASGNPYYLTVYENHLYFTAADSADGYQVWRTDGTPTGTQKFFVLVPGRTATASMPPRYYREFNHRLYFIGAASANANVLWSTDGTSAGTQVFAPPGSGLVSSMFVNQQGIVPWQNKLWVQAYFTTAQGNEIWSYVDTTLTTGVQGLNTRNLVLYPNPVHDNIKVEWENAGEPSTLRFFDLSGRLLHEIHFGSSVHRASISCEDLSPGVYLLEISQAKERQWARFVRD